MKTLNCVLLAILLLITVTLAAPPAYAQDDAEQEQPTETRPRATLHLNPFTALLGLVNADVSFPIKPKFTLGPAMRIADYNLFLLKEDSIGLGLRFAYFAKNPYTNSFFVSTSPLYTWGRVSSRAFSARTEADFTRFYIDAIGGYQWHWVHFNLGIGLGLAYNSVTLSELRGKAGNLEGKIKTFGFTTTAGILPATKLTFGWSF